MTTDFVVDVLRGGELVTEGLAFKPSTELEKPQTLQKLQIERLYWGEQGVSWRIVTELDLHMALVKNLEWIRTPAFEHQEESWGGRSRETLSQVLHAVSLSPNQSLGAFCARTDECLSLEIGTTLMTIRTLLATKSIRADMTVPLNDKVSMGVFQVVTASGARSVG